MTYKEIWQKLSAIDCSAHVEKKNSMNYLSWAWAWGVLMEYYPQAQYSFPPAEVHPDGTVTVYCDIAIGGCVRQMWLPVMDYKNNAIRNPDARKISDTRMRCLVKNLAMWGLGHAIYAGEDVAAVTTPEHEAVTEETLLEEAPITKPVKKKVPTKNGPNNIPDEAGAAEIVEKLLQFARQFCKDTKSLRNFWSENKQIIDILDSNFPVQYEVLKTGFTELKTKYEGATDNG